MSSNDQTNTEQYFWTNERSAALEAKLDPKLTAQRDAFDGGRRKLTYLEGHAVIAQLNRIFGYGGWSYTLDQMSVDEWCEGPQEDWYAQFFAVVTLRVGGASRQDVGTAEVRNTKRTEQRSGEVIVRNNVRNVDSRATARKGAVTDALKRAARTFGQQFGNGLYDQDDNIYAWMAAHSLDEGEVVQSEVPPATAAQNGSAGPQAKVPAEPQSRAPQSRTVVEPLLAPAAPGIGPAAWTQKQLGARVRELAGVTLPKLANWQGLARTYGLPSPAQPGDMTRDWLLGLYQTMQTRVLEERIRQVPTEAEVRAVMMDAIGLRDRREISMEQYGALDAQADARYGELAGPSPEEHDLDHEGAALAGDAAERAKELGRRISGARSEGEIAAVLRASQQAKDQGQITQDHRVELLRMADTRRAALSGPLTANAV